MGTPVPYRWITGLDKKAQQELERNFFALQQQITGGAPHNGNTYFIACSDAQAWEKAVADITLTGAADDVLIQTLLDAHPDCSIKFSSGSVFLAATVQLYSGMEVSGSAVSTTTGNNYVTTTINMAGASANYLGGPTAPVAFNWSSGLAAKGQGADLWIHRLAFHTGMSGAPTDKIIFSGSNLGSYHIHLSELEFDNTITKVCAGTINNRFQMCVFENLWGIAGTTLNADLADSALINIQGITCTQTNTFRTLFVKTSQDNNTPSNSNIILPQSSLPPSGTAGGDLAGAFPNPTVGIASGLATLAAGTKVVSTAAIAAGSKVFLTTQVLGTVAVPKEVAVTARTAGVSFTITSADVTDTSQVAWFIIQ